MSEDRHRQFKNFGKDTQELRRRRADAIVELRKSRKDEQLTKRRNIDLDETDFIGHNGHHSNGSSNGLDISNGDGVFTSTKLSNGNHHQKQNGLAQLDPSNQVSFITLGKITGDIFSGIPKQEFIGCQMARKILSRERHPPIEPIIKSGIIPKCIELLKSPNYDTQFEAAWIVTNIASGTSAQTNYVVEQGAVDPLIEMLKLPQAHLVEQAIWALGNIAGDGTVLRDMLIGKGIIPPLIGLVKTQTSPSFLRNVAWTLSNLCRSKQPSPPTEAVRQILPALIRLIMLDDIEIISDTCWALSYLSDGPNEKIEDVVQAGIVPRVVELLNARDYSIITPCLRVIGNIVTGNDSQTDRVLRSGPVLQYLGRLLMSPKPTISKEAAWAISNITAGTISQINEVINAALVPSLVHIIQNGDFRAQKEAVWCITNITSGGTLDHIVFLCRNGIIPAFCSILKCKDWKTVMVAMDGLENILRSASAVEELDRVQLAVEECGGLDALEALQNHENTTVYTRAYTIVAKYFSDQHEVEDLLPTTNATTGQFEMTVAAPPTNGFDI